MKNSPISLTDACRTIVQAVVSKPDEVEVEEREENGTYNLSIKVAKEDMGRVIGKEGKIIRAIRSLLRVRAIKEGKRIQVQLLE